jgi:hypothetical protein
VPNELEDPRDDFHCYGGCIRIVLVGGGEVVCIKCPTKDDWQKDSSDDGLKEEIEATVDNGYEGGQVKREIWDGKPIGQRNQHRAVSALHRISITQEQCGNGKAYVREVWLQRESKERMPYGC